MNARLRSITILAVACALAGCKTRPEARYVLRSPDMGVIAMPEDNPANRERAIALMHSHFPEGYEIICEGEDAVMAPLPRTVHTHHGPHRHRRIEPVAVAAWNEPGFQQQVESLPGTPQSMEGYARHPVPSVGVHVGDIPPQPVGVLRSEWRITYRRKDAAAAPGDESAPQSLFPAYHAGADDIRAVQHGP